MTKRNDTPELAHLKTFLTVCRAGTIGQAARQLKVSQPAISAHLKALEKGFGRKLLSRSPQGVKPTPAGEVLQNQIEPHIDELATLAIADQEIKGLAVIGGPADLLSMRAIPALSSLIAEGVRVKMKTGIAENLLDQLEAEELDVVIATRWPPGRDDVQFEPLFDEEHILVGNKEWRQRINSRTPEIAAQNLAAADFLAFDEQLALIRDHPFIREHYARIFGNSPSNHVALYASDLRALRNTAIVGGGIAVIPRYMAAHALETKQLFELLRPSVPRFNTIYIATRRGAIHPRVQQIITTLKHVSSEWDKASAVLITISR